MKKQQSLTKADCLWLFSFLAGLAFILYKCRFGFANVDECFYLTIPYRLYQGDALFWNEWNLAQTASFLLYPFFWVYMRIFGSTEGIVLAFRYIFTIVHSITAAFLYLRLRKVNWGAAFASVLYLLFTPFGIMALSYNSMAVGLLVITAVLLYGNREGKPLVFAAGGMAFAGAVLCCPFLVLAFVLCWAGVLLCRRRLQPETGKRLLRSALWFTGGCAAAACAFLAFVFQRCSLKELLTVLPLLLDDPSHPTPSFFDAAGTFFSAIFHSNALAPGIFLCAGVLALAIVLDRRCQKRKLWYFLAALVLTAVYTLPFLTTDVFLNHMMFPLSLLGLFCFLLEPKKLLREFLCLWLPGFFYMFCINWASNVRFYAISDAACISSLGSILMAVSFLSGQEDFSRRLRQRVLPLFLTLFVLSTGYVRYHSLFWEQGGMEDMTYQITFGAQKGLHTSAYFGENYSYYHSITAPVRNASAEKVLYYTNQTWLYLDDAKKNASYSAWLTTDDAATADRLVRFYDLQPDMLPDIVFAPNGFWQEDSSIAQYLHSLGYQRETVFGGLVLTRP